MKCYKCVSTESWDDCNDIKTEIDCPAKYDRCYKVYADVKVKGASVKEYVKGCFTEDECNTDLSSFCKGKGKCKLDCCSGDLCNVATLQKVSAAVLIACTLMALLY